MSRTTVLWHCSAQVPPTAQPLHGPAWWSPTSPALHGHLSRPAANAVLLVPVALAEPCELGRRSPPCAVALVPETSRGLHLNGVACTGGSHLLHHADLLHAAASSLWVAVEVAPDELDYEPGPDGPECCAKLKTRLTKERVIRCPGTPRRPCGRLYRARAWQTGVTCECGFASDAPERWSPPLPLQKGSYRALLACTP